MHTKHSWIFPIFPAQKSTEAGKRLIYTNFVIPVAENLVTTASIRKNLHSFHFFQRKIFNPTPFHLAVALQVHNIINSCIFYF